MKAKKSIGKILFMLIPLAVAIALLCIFPGYFEIFRAWSNPIVFYCISTLIVLCEAALGWFACSAKENAAKKSVIVGTSVTAAAALTLLCAISFVLNNVIFRSIHSDWTAAIIFAGIMVFTLVCITVFYARNAKKHGWRNGHFPFGRWEHGCPPRI